MPVLWEIEFDQTPASNGRGFSFDMGDPPAAALRITAHNALTGRGFVRFMLISAVLMGVPIVALLGRPQLWFILIFAVLVYAAVWFAIRRNWADRQPVETFRVWTDHAELAHFPNAKTLAKIWTTNPYWLRVELHEDTGPVPAYLTLNARDEKREIGRLLSEEERRALKPELVQLLSDINRMGG